MQFEYSSTLKTLPVSTRFVSYLLSEKAISYYLQSSDIASMLKGSLITVSFIGAKRMQSLNSDYRGKHKPTDILTFEYHEGNIAGEVYICMEEIVRNARQLQHSVEYEVTEIFVHGLLHMCGVEHSEQMFKTQREIAHNVLESYT